MVKVERGSAGERGSPHYGWWAVKGGGIGANYLCDVYFMMSSLMGSSSIVLVPSIMDIANSHGTVGSSAICSPHPRIRNCR